MHMDSSQCRRWCELQKQYRQGALTSGQRGQGPGSGQGTEEAEGAAWQEELDQPSVLEQQQQGEHSAAAAVHAVSAEEPIEKVRQTAQP